MTLVSMRQSHSVDKDHLPNQIVTARTVVRKAAAADLAALAAWPPYDRRHQVFNLTDPPADSASGKLAWWRQIDQPDRCHYSVVLPGTQEVVGVHAFVQIDWTERMVGNMGIRIRPDCCDRGYCTETLRPLLAALLAAGMRRIRLDVAATNARAIRAYIKSGLAVTGEFWREHTGGPIDDRDPNWPVIAPHLKTVDGRVMVRFHWMEIPRYA